MNQPKNILFIMFDQLRWDYLSCYGHPTLHTPNIDRLARHGVRFNKVYVQSPLCGPSRMSYYTGRYVNSHGATNNGVPLKIGEKTMGEYLRAEGMSCSLVGKTHMKADLAGMERLGISPDSEVGVRLSECGFDIFERDDGLRAEGPIGYEDGHSAVIYNDYLRSKGYTGDNPWHEYANSGIDEDGRNLSGWFLENADQPANIREEDSETPYLTRRGIEFIEAQGEDPWCCHLSYIKPHWPYIVPAPYHNMYGPDAVLPVVRSDAECQTAHPVVKAFMENPEGKAFSQVHVRLKVIGAYMGLIKQCDDQMGVLFDYLESSGRMKDTVIVLTSDHGDYLGDHWLGEKMYFHDCSSRVPLIIYDPSAEADVTRGTVCDEIVEAIDLVPTFIDFAGGTSADHVHVLDGRSLLPYIRGGERTDRVFAISEFDFALGGRAAALGLPVGDAKMFMVATKEFKLVHYTGGFRPSLFDLRNDPDELVDLGDDPAYAEVISEMYRNLLDWALRPTQRTTLLFDRIRRSRAGRPSDTGVLIGIVDESEISEEVLPYIVGKQVRNMTTG